jgi:hypothetical protein
MNVILTLDLGTATGRGHAVLATRMADAKVNAALNKPVNVNKDVHELEATQR